MIRRTLVLGLCTFILALTLAAQAASGTTKFNTITKAYANTAGYALIYISGTDTKNAATPLYSFYSPQKATLDDCLKKAQGVMKHKKGKLTIGWHEYTFTTGSMKGSTVKQIDSCKASRK